MEENQIGSSTMDEVIELKNKFENIKNETEEFIVSAKRLSDTGLKEAKELIESAKANWKSILVSFGEAGISKIFGQARGLAKKKSGSKAKKSSKKVTKKKTKKKK